ncbi:dATP/dGTP diphosphohydrolase domain-containing protein [Kribbella sindirgiensis]|uniref:dATP/dGTP diphosphohydrolase N-terminal domain-containing protein n=1 Tax=Kribbella sindirgiensis TaxID=1124744 RepID=A0A4R0IBN4_9ACTN|nr:dATP/dGTP diphosphohydrolase domain-containing protein [Kribbella sindirgiensis]TCC19932.1 hypothetical protein E0H50_37515 [Kribbella sindirgiensis]
MTEAVRAMQAGEVRVTSETGGAKGDKLARFDQIPAGPMLELAYRYGLGSTKYEQKNGLDNWRNGYRFSLSMAALERHYYAFKNGEDYDGTIYREAGLIGEDDNPIYDEDWNLRPGVSHLAAVAWHCFFLMHHLEHNPQLDDRPSTVLKRNAEADLTAVVEATAEPNEFAGGAEEVREAREHAAVTGEPVIFKQGLPLEVVDEDGDTWLRAPAGDSYAIAGDNSPGDRLAAVERAERRLAEGILHNTYEGVKEHFGPLTIVRGDAA